MTVTLRERNRLAAMEQVRSVAFAVMSTHGFDAVTVEQIADRSGISPSTVYRYFGTKEALVLSAARPARLVEQLRGDASGQTWTECFRRAAVAVWEEDDAAETEMGLIVANVALLHAWERQFLDHRADIATAFAHHRGKSGGAKDDTRAAASVAVLTTTLLRWHREGGAKPLDRLLAKAFDAVRLD